LDRSSRRPPGFFDKRLCSWCDQMRPCPYGGKGWHIRLLWPTDSQLLVVLVCPSCWGSSLGRSSVESLKHTG
jgi:hypothetical protein